MPELTFLRFLLIILATSRITHILQNEDSPFHLIERFREWVESKPSEEGSFLFTLQKWFGCVYCGSVAVGIFLIPLAYYLAYFFKIEILMDYVLAGFGASQIMVFWYVSLPKHISQWQAISQNHTNKTTQAITQLSNAIKKEK